MEKMTFLTIFEKATEGRCSQKYINSCLSMLQEGEGNFDIWLPNWCSGIKYMFKDFTKNVEFIKKQCEALEEILEIQELFGALYTKLLTGGE